jgi:chromosome segregation protein
MRIKELEIDNFKSFSNQVNIPFLEGFTTISGPNGSGKSNIIDSILFALGLTTSRALRSERGVGDLISTHNNRNEVYVKVIFDVEDEDLSFARRVKKSPQGFNSTYYINDKACTLTQMHHALEKYNITPNSYNVIMQGDVTSITNCSPSERRKIIDEIAGTADFDRKIDLASRELETVDERVMRSNIVLAEIDSRLEELHSEREVALKYKGIKDEKTALEAQVTSVKYLDLKRSSELVHQNILDATREKKRQESELEAIAQDIEDFKAEYQKLCDKVREKGEDARL